MVLQAIEHGVDRGLALEQLIPLPIGEVSGNQRGLAAIAQVEELEEGVALYGLHGQIAELVNELLCAVEAFVVTVDQHLSNSPRASPVLRAPGGHR